MGHAWQVLCKHNWNLADEMFNTPTVDWSSLAADLAELMPAVDYDFQVQITVSHHGFIWSEHFEKKIEEFNVQALQ